MPSASGKHADSSYKALISKNRPDLRPYEKLYKQIHSNAELSMQENETAELIAKHLQSLSPDFDVRTSIGGTGLIGILKNTSQSDGDKNMTVLLRADMDALPVAEETDLDFASEKTMKDTDGEVKPVMHACGHDLHVTALLAAAETLLACREHWNGTVIFLFQPGEERALGAKAMVKDGLYDPKRHGCPVPDVVLGQHVLPFKAGSVASRHGAPMTAADSFEITIYGRGGHASQPHTTVDPLVVACFVVIRWQTIVSREVPPSEIAVVSVGSIQSGATEDVISDKAVLKVNIRSVSEEWRGKILESIKRIVTLECEIAQCPKPPKIVKTSEFPLTINDDNTLNTIGEGFSGYFGDAYNPDMANALASEDFSVLATAVDRPCCYWVFGGVDPDEYDQHKENETLGEIPGNHSATFAPVLQPSLTVGVDAMTVATLSVLGSKG